MPSFEQRVVIWLKSHLMHPTDRREAAVERPKPQGRSMSGEYLSLHKYLEERYANTVVLSFGEIEDLLGFSLPDQARVRQEWWTEAAARVAGSNYADSWILA